MGSKEAINEIEQINIDPKEEKLSSSDMQNYLLSHVLFDNTEQKPQQKRKKEKSTKKKESKSKKEDIDTYLDEDYKKHIEQYCVLIDEDNKKTKKKDINEKKADLPQIKMVDVKSRQEQLQSQL